MQLIVLLFLLQLLILLSAAVAVAVAAGVSCCCARCRVFTAVHNDIVPIRQRRSAFSEHATEGSDSQSVAVLQVQDTEVHVGNLLPCSLYEISVRAVSEGFVATAQSTCAEVWRRIWTLRGIGGFSAPPPPPTLPSAGSEDFRSCLLSPNQAIGWVTSAHWQIPSPQRRRSLRYQR